MSRYRAGLIHLAISAAVLAPLLTFAILVWYPPPLLAAVGAGMLLLIVAGAHVALGPLLTTLVFRSGKWGMRFDLAFIGVVQAVALAYGCYAVLVARPAYLVFSIDRFDLVTRADLAPEEQAKAAPEFRQAPLLGYRTVAAMLPADAGERDRITLSAVFAGRDLSHFPQHFVRYDVPTALVAVGKAHGIEQLRQASPGAADRLVRWLRARGLEESAVVILPVKARGSDLIAVLEKGSGRLIELAPFQSW